MNKDTGEIRKLGEGDEPSPEEVEVTAGEAKELAKVPPSARAVALQVLRRKKFDHVKRRRKLAAKSRKLPHTYARSKAHRGNGKT